MTLRGRSIQRRLMPFRCATLLIAATLLGVLPAHAESVSKKFKLEQNRPLGLDLSAGQVTADQAVFEFPSSVMRLETANKARIAVTNGGAAKVRIGLAIALFDDAGNLVAAGAGGNKGGTLAPGAKEEFSVFFYYVSERISSATSFQIALEVK